MSELLGTPPQERALKDFANQQTMFVVPEIPDSPKLTFWKSACPIC
jgi:hypothetical protein